MFPEYRDLITKLKQEDAHFARLFDEHNELDDKISGLLNNEVTAVSAAEEIEGLKLKKLALKDTPRPMRNARRRLSARARAAGAARAARAGARRRPPAGTRPSRAGPRRLS